MSKSVHLVSRSHVYIQMFPNSGARQTS